VHSKATAYRDHGHGSATELDLALPWSQASIPPDNTSQRKEKVTDTIDRRLVTGERIMLAHVYLEKGSIVPMHQHENEQLTYVLEGGLRFWIESEDAEPIDVTSGQVLTIPSNVPHKAEVLETTLDVDVFSPPRQDWLDGTDTYFHEG
jgi:quercetin dioxygenase-like cupin family protein